MLPPNYVESRNKFNALAKELGATLVSYVHETPANELPPLSTDTAYLGSVQAPTLVVISSGTHGVEGYAGAACQYRFMQNYRERYESEHIAYLLVHAVNPWGFFHDRRVTCEGVDLNRNFAEFPVRPVSAYGKYHDMLVSNFRPLPLGLLNELRFLVYGLTRKRRRALQAAITCGQYEYPEGLFFGGFASTQSRQLWERILATNVQQQRRIVLLDIHTGLGKWGNGDLQPSSKIFQEMSAWFHGDLKSMAAGQSVSAIVAGTLTSAFSRMFAVPSYAVGLEFGTKSALSVLNAMRADHWYCQHRADLPEQLGRRIRERMRNVFAPENPDWYQRIAQRFDQVMAQLHVGLERG
jgi:hypothetical protein